MPPFQRFDSILFGSKKGQTRVTRQKRSRRALKKTHECSLERLEPRIALDATGVTQIQRPPLQQSHAIYLYAGNPDSAGPLPVQLGKSDVIGSEANSFVVTHVTNGIVEKWDDLKQEWRDVSTKPTSSNPMELLRLLKDRHIESDDLLRWVPATNTSTLSPIAAFKTLPWNTAEGPTESDCPGTTVFQVSSSVQALGAAGGPTPESIAAQTTETTCDCGCPTPPPLENLQAQEVSGGAIKVSWDKSHNSNIELLETIKLKAPDGTRFEASDLVWHDGLQRFFAVSDDGGYLATFEYDGTGITGDDVVQQYWDLTSQLREKLGDKWTENAQSFEGLTFKNSDSLTDMVIYIGTEFESDTSNRIIEFDFTGSFDPETGTWLGASGLIKNVFDLEEVMPGADDDNNKKAGLEALTFVPDTTGGVFYVGQQYDGAILKLKLNSETGAVEKVGTVIFEDLPRVNGFVDLSAMQYLKIDGDPYLLTLFGEGYNDGDTDYKGNDTPVRISISKLTDLEEFETKARKGITWAQQGDRVKEDWPSLFGIDSQGNLNEAYGMQGPEGIAYFTHNGEPRLAIGSDPGKYQTLDGERIGHVKVFGGIDFSKPQVTYVTKISDEAGNTAVYPLGLQALAEHQGGYGQTFTTEVRALGTLADGTTGQLAALGATQITTSKIKTTIVIRHAQDNGSTNRDEELREHGVIKQDESYIAKLPDSGNIHYLLPNESDKVEHNGSPLGIESNSELKDEGWQQANSYSTVLPALTDKLAAEPISRIMIDSYWRANDLGHGTSNPIDTALPFIIQTASSTPGLQVDLVPYTDGQQVDKDPWHNLYVSSPEIVGVSDSSDVGSVLIVSTGQGIYGKEKKVGFTFENSILDDLSQKYGLTGDLEAYVSKNPTAKGVTIYVFGDLDQNASNGNEMYVYNHEWEEKTFSDVIAQFS